MRKRILLVTVFVLFIVGIEIYLRCYWGFCDAVLMKADPDFEYIAQPSQNRFRFRHPIYYNAYSMRSAEIRAKSKKILGLGDSVINGGAHTDQDSIATTLLSEQLTNEWGQDIQVLNISAGSWGPDNTMAYIKKQGDFDAQIAFLVVSSHDAHDNMDFEGVVDIQASFPSKQYKSAIYEIVDRYLIPRLFKKNNPPEALGINKGGTSFNTGFKDLGDYFSEKEIPFFIYLHPEKIEVQNKKYTNQGEEIIDFCRDQNIKVILAIDYFNENDYRDDIHPNESGQKKMAALIHDELVN
jgi:lysophospholipase L1-like esterase